MASCWLYNQLVRLHDVAAPANNGNFLPALDLAEMLLGKRRHAECVQSLLFLSDGRPSDHGWYLRASSPKEVADKITGRVRALAEVFGEQLSVLTLGFAGPDQDFSVPEAMAGAARDGGVARKVSSAGDIFKGPGNRTCRERFVPDGYEASAHDVRGRKKAPSGAGTPWGHAPTTSQTRDGWVVYTSEVERYEFSLDTIKYNAGDLWVSANLFSEEANGIAIRSKALGEGAQRLVVGIQACTSKSYYFLQAQSNAQPSLTYGVALREHVDDRKHAYYCLAGVIVHSIAVETMSVSLPFLAFIEPIGLYAGNENAAEQ